MSTKPEPMNQHSRRMPWTEQENAVLCEFYPTIGQRVSSMLPGRSRAACSIHASHLGISRENDWAEAEDDLLRKYYPTLGPDASTKISGNPGYPQGKVPMDKARRCYPYQGFPVKGDCGKKATSSPDKAKHLLQSSKTWPSIQIQKTMDRRRALHPARAVSFFRTGCCKVPAQ